MATRPPELDFFNISEIAQICQISLKTATRWKRGQSVPPATALMVLRRDLGCLHPEWKGWVITHHGELCSPEKWLTMPGAVLAMHFHHAQMSALREQIADLRNRLRVEEVEQYEEQPTPTQWEIAVS